MRVEAELFRNRAWLEILLGIGAVSAVVYVMFTYPEGPFESKTWFVLAMGVGAWLPVLARTSWRRLGDVRLDARALILRTWVGERRIPFARIRGVRAAKGRRGGSVLLSLRDGTLLAFAVDSPREGASFARELRERAKADDAIFVPVRRGVGLATVLRVVTSAAALAYYLHEVRGVIGGDKGLYGLSGIFAGLALLGWHIASQRRPVMIGDTSVWPSVGPLFAHLPRSIRAHVDLHAAALDAGDSPESEPAIDPLLLPGETAAQGFARIRAQLERDGAYRGEAAALRGRLEETVSAVAAPVTDRAIALRILAAGARPEVEKRLAAVELSREERAWLEAIAIADDDRAAVKRLARRAPRLEP